MKILVLESDMQSARALEAVLQSGGHRVHVVSDGADALLEAAEWAPNLVVIDLKCPIIDGLTFCRTLRRTSDVPILVLSAQRDIAVLIAALDAGADGYVAKPFSVSELQARIRAFVRRYEPNTIKGSVRSSEEDWPNGSPEL